MSTPKERDNEESSRAAEILIFFVALWLVLCPFVFQFSLIRAALWNSMGVGFSLFVLTGIRLDNLHSKWPSYVDMALSAWLVLAPFAMGYAGMAVPLINCLIPASVICLLASWSIIDSPQTSKEDLFNVQAGPLRHKIVTRRRG